MSDEEKSVETVENVAPVAKGSQVPEAAEEHPERAQHPAANGDDQLEIAERTADSDKDRLKAFVKEFIVQLVDVAKDDEMHARNKLSVLNEAIQRGLHPKGDVKLVKSTNLDDGRNSSHVYQVNVTPACVDDDHPSTVTPSKVLADD